MHLSHVLESTILNSTFSNNSAQQTATIAVIASALTYMENVIFFGNIETGYMIQNFLLHIITSVFRNMDKVTNTYGLELKTAGVLTGKHESQLIITKCYFVQNQAVYAGVGLFTDNVHVIFDGSSFVDNSGKYVGVFEAVNCIKVEIRDSYFKGNKGTIADIGLLAENSHMNVFNITLDGIIDTANAFSLGSRRNSSLTVSNSIIKNITMNSHNYCLFQSSKSSALKLYNIIIESNNMTCASLISHKSLMIINNSTITENTFRNSLVTVSDYSILELYDSIVEQNSMTDADHDGREYSLFLLHKNSQVQGTHFKMKGNTARDGVIYCEDQALINISQSVFADNEALQSGGVLSSSNCTVIMQNGYVTGNRARYNEGAITLLDSVVLVCMNGESVGTAFLTRSSSALFFAI